MIRVDDDAVREGRTVDEREGAPRDGVEEPFRAVAEHDRVDDQAVFVDQAVPSSWKHGRSIPGLPPRRDSRLGASRSCAGADRRSVVAIICDML